MSVRFDDKGKFFTNIITKDQIPSTIQTPTSRIEGILHVRIDERVKDELNRDNQFLAITDAVIYNLEGQKIYDAEFLLINRNHVIWIIPDEKNIQNDNQGEDEV